MSAGGSHAWWWGTWLQRGHLYWALRDADGRFWSGKREVPADVLDLAARLAPVPTEQEHALARDLATNPRQADQWATLAATARTLAGPMIGSADAAAVVDALLPEALRSGRIAVTVSFAEAMSILGDAVLPQPLLDAVHHTTTTPVRLVASIAPGLSWLPIPLLGSGDRLLIEQATVSLMPPWPVADLLRNADNPPTRPLRVSVSVVDPRGDLRHARNLGISADVTLGSTAALPASRTHLRTALDRADPDSLFVFQGHVELTDLGEPATASLVLADDDGPSHLSSLDVMSEAEGWHFPHSLLLDGCASTNNWGSAEWSGLVPTMLQRGARQVVSTLWPLIDSPQTAEVTSQIARAVLDHGDAATAVSVVQRRYVADYRTGSSAVPPHAFGAHKVTGVSISPIT